MLYVITWHSVLAAPVNMLVLIVFEAITQETLFSSFFFFFFFSGPLVSVALAEDSRLLMTLRIWWEQ